MPPLIQKKISAEALCLYKIAEEDFSLQSCDDLNLLFRKMFLDSGIAERFTLSRQKTSYVICDVLSPLLSNEICNDVRNSMMSTFILMFDETTTKQNKKQNNILLRYFSKTTNLVGTRCLLSFFLQGLLQILLLKNSRICKMTKIIIYPGTGYSTYL